MLSGELGELSKQPATELLERKARLTQLQAPPLSRADAANHALFTCC